MGPRCGSFCLDLARRPLVLLYSNAKKGTLKISLWVRSWGPDSKSWDVFPSPGSWEMEVCFLLNNHLSRNTVKRHCLWELLCPHVVLCPCVPALMDPSFAVSRVGIVIVSGLLELVFCYVYLETETHTCQSGTCSLENERVKKALTTKVFPLLHGRESTREHEIPYEGLNVQQFLWAWGPAFNLIPTQVEVT